MARIFNAISDLFAAGLILCAAGLGAIWFSGCAAGTPQATVPGVVQTVEDCYACVACAKDLYQRAKGPEAADAGAE